MRKWREVAACTDRAFFWNNRMHPPIKHFAKQIDNFDTHSAEAERQNIGTQHHHRAHLWFGERCSNSAGVTANKVQLKLAQVTARDSNIRQLAETSGNTVNHHIARNDFFDEFAR